MRISKLFSILFLVILLVSCDERTQSIPQARVLTSDSGYSIRVVRGEDRLEIISPEILAGSVFYFSDSENYFECSDTVFPVSTECAASFCDFLTMAYPCDYGFDGQSSFEHKGASFTAVYGEGGLERITVSRGGVDRSVSVDDG